MATAMALSSPGGRDIVESGLGRVSRLTHTHTHATYSTHLPTASLVPELLPPSVAVQYAGGDARTPSEAVSAPQCLFCDTPPS